MKRMSKQYRLSQRHIENPKIYKKEFKKFLKNIVRSVHEQQLT